MAQLVLCIKDCKAPLSVAAAPLAGKVYIIADKGNCPACDKSAYVCVEGFGYPVPAKERHCFGCGYRPIRFSHNLVCWRASHFVPLNDPDFKGEDTGEHLSKPKPVKVPVLVRP